MHINGKETDWQQEELDFILLFISRLDAWILTVLLGMVSEKKPGGQKQKIYLDKFQKILNFNGPFGCGSLPLWKFGSPKT